MERHGFRGLRLLPTVGCPVLAFNPRQPPFKAFTIVPQVAVHQKTKRTLIAESGMRKVPFADPYQKSAWPLLDPLRALAGPFVLVCNQQASQRLRCSRKCAMCVRPHGAA
jgi:hypothetical protein